jgi:hypothetical protein
MIGPTGGIQLYDPFNTPHAQGLVGLPLDTSPNYLAYGAAFNAPFLYLADGYSE